MSGAAGDRSWSRTRTNPFTGTPFVPSDNVEELYSAPHIHEQMTTSYYGYDNIMLEHNAMNNIDTVAHMNVHNTQY